MHTIELLEVYYTQNTHVYSFTYSVLTSSSEIQNPQPKNEIEKKRKEKHMKIEKKRRKEIQMVNFARTETITAGLS